MTTPPLSPIDLIRKLGPNFDYSAIGRIKASPAFNSLDPQTQQAINQLVGFGVDIERVRNPAPRDKIGEGAFPAPPIPPSSSTPGSYVDQLQSIVNNIPGYGPISAAIAAWTDSRRLGISFDEALGRQNARTAATAQEFLHQATVGLVPSPEVEAGQREAFNTVVKPVTGLVAMGLQGATVVRALGLVSKVPVATNILEQLPQRLRDVGMGMTTLGVLDGLRADGVPSDPSVLDPSGNLAHKLVQMGVPDRLALIAAGGTVGGIMGGTILGIQRGIEWGREMQFGRLATPELVRAMQDALKTLGYSVDAGTSKGKTVSLYMKAMKRVFNDEELAGLASERLSREEWITQQIFGSADIAQVSTEDARYLTGLLRGQPGQVSVARDIADPIQVQMAAERLGLQVDVVPVNRAPEPTPIKGQFEVDRHLKDGRKIETQRVLVTPSAQEPGKWQVTNLRNMGRDEWNPIGHETVETEAKAYALARKGGATTVGPAEGGVKVRQSVGDIPAPIYDVLITRPNYTYTPFDQLPRATKRANGLVAKAAADDKRDLFAQKTNDIFILPDGSTVRGGFSTEELAKRLRPQAPVVDGVARPDLGVKHVAQMVNLAIQEDGNLIIDLPTRLSQEQFDAIGPAVNVTRFDKVLIKSSDGVTKVIEGPMGQQVQDAVAKMVKPTSQVSKLTPELVGQYKRQGVFNGQAAVLADGTPVRVQKKAGIVYAVEDPLTGKVISVHPSKLTVLPTTLEGELAPSNMFYQYLSEDERQAFAKLRVGIEQGLDRPIEDFKTLEKFANSRGLLADRGPKRGTVILRRTTDGEAMQFADRQAAAEFVRKSTGPMPDLTPDVVKSVLGGDTAFGFTTQQGAPMKMGEIIPIPHSMVVTALKENLKGRGPGGLEMAMKPTRGLFLDIDKRFGTQFFPLFDNLQSRMVQRQNFETLWFEGRGARLPDGILPLEKIEKMAGKDANLERITEWLEAKPLDKPTIMQEMTAGERAAAPELRKWYDGLFKELGVEDTYLENYAPRLRELAPAYGNNPAAMLKAGLLSDPLNPQAAISKGIEFFGDNYRTGSLDVYDTHAFRVATRYLQQGAGNRFMKEPLQQAAQMVSQLAATNKSLAYPLGYFLQAIRGTEFSEQRLALSETMQRVLDALPGQVREKEVSDLADKLTAYWMGAVYTGTMGFRPGLALRNVGTSIMMTWPLFGGNKGRYLEALGVALTREGMEAAVADGAISLKQRSIYKGDEFTARLPQGFDKLAEAGFSMYDTSDQYTRAQAYWAARLRSQDAISTFMEKAVGASEAQVGKLRTDLLRDSGMMMQDKQVADEFMRRMLVSPESAARYAGKQASDVVNFLYGRGMQPRWMRGVTGRMMGQFGTWSLWYIDYLRRTTVNLRNNGGVLEAGKFLAKHALVNAAVAYGGHKALDVDLGRWMTYPAVFYSGGPGFQLAVGLTTMARGLTGVAEAADDPYARQRVGTGISLIQHTLPSMVPFYFGGRDAIRLARADSPAEVLAATLATDVDKQYLEDRKWKMLLGEPEPFSTSSDVLTHMVNQAARGQTQNWVNPNEIGQRPLPAGPAGAPQLQPPPNVQGTGAPPAPPSMVLPAGGLQYPQIQPKRIPGEAVKSGETRPPTL